MAILSINSYAENVNTLVEFFSFTCKHCANVNDKLEQYIAKNNIKYLDINVDWNQMALPTNIMYYIALDAGIGNKFKRVYFEAIANGMQAYTPDTLNYVVSQVKTPGMTKLINSKEEREHIRQKMNYANALLKKYKIKATPTFLINQTVLLEGEDVITSLSNGMN